jgi:hypothetical protein
MKGGGQLDEMNVGRPRRSIPARAVVSLLVATLALMRALIPAGYMLDRTDDDGRLVVQMCSDAGTHSVVVDLKTGAVSEDTEQWDTSAPSDTRKSTNGEISCPFALSAIASLPTASVAVTPTILNDLRIVEHYPIASPVAWLSRPPLPGRGPPGVA